MVTTDIRRTVHERADMADLASLSSLTVSDPSLLGALDDETPRHPPSPPTAAGSSLPHPVQISGGGRPHVATETRWGIGNPFERRVEMMSDDAIWPATVGDERPPVTVAAVSDTDRMDALWAAHRAVHSHQGRLRVRSAAALLRQRHPQAARLRLGECYDPECGDRRHPEELMDRAGTVLIDFNATDLPDHDVDLKYEVFDRICDVEALPGVLDEYSDPLNRRICELHIQAAMNLEPTVEPEVAGRTLLDQHAALFATPVPCDAGPYERAAAAQRMVSDLCAHLHQIGVDPSWVLAQAVSLAMTRTPQALGGL